ncbi:MAG TPA: CmcI family methyltransferase [Herpetosiphonaceae bacterium]
MPKISIITPWSSETLDLLPDYSRAVAGAEVVTVDNASGPATAAALREWHAEHGIYRRNDHNAGFAAGNNQGYARATGDIIVFLNSDVVPAGDWLGMVAADVRDGALYGPELGQQCVGGRWLPYLSGWCIAATRATWEQLIDEWNERDERHAIVGPWDAIYYPGPYWEDNDLCLRALQAGISLVQTAWPIQHKGGRTAGALSRWAESFEANRRTFGDRVWASLKPTQPTPTYATYLNHLYTPSDIQHHLPLLYSLARGNVLELGTRSGVSTAALLAGVEQHGGYVWSVDVDPRSSQVAAGHPLWQFIQGSSIERETVNVLYDHFAKVLPPESNPLINLLFIDTLHTYQHVKAELELWSHWVREGGHICIHDPETFPGVRRAVQEFCDARGWPVTFVLPCNGMAVIEVPPAQPVERAGAAIESYLAGAK